MSELLEQLHTLSDRDKKTILDKLSNEFRAKELIGADAAQSAKESRDADLVMVHAEMTAALQRIGYPRNIPLDSLLAGEVGSVLKAGTKILLAFVRQHFGAKHRAEEIKCVRLCLDRIIAYQRSTKRRPTTFKTVAQDIRNIAAIIDLDYPGYIASGLLPLLLKRSH